MGNDITKDMAKQIETNCYNNISPGMGTTMQIQECQNQLVQSMNQINNNFIKTNIDLEKSVQNLNKLIKNIEQNTADIKNTTDSNLNQTLLIKETTDVMVSDNNAIIASLKKIYKKGCNNALFIFICFYVAFSFISNMYIIFVLLSR